MAQDQKADETVHTSARKGLANSVLGTRNLMMVAALSVVGLILLIPLNYIAPAFGASPKSVWIGCSMMGLWVIPYLLPSTVVRRPGATMVASLIMGVISIFTTPAGPSAVIGNLIGGAFIELPLAFTLYKKWNNWMFMICAGLFGTLNGTMYLALLSSITSAKINSLIVVTSIVSALLGGLATIGITKLLNRAGVGVANRA